MTTVASILAPQSGRADVAGGKSGTTGAASGVQNFLAIIAGLTGKTGQPDAVTLGASIKMPSQEGSGPSMVSGALIEANGDLVLQADLSKGLVAFEKAASAFLGGLEIQASADGGVPELPDGALEAMAEVIGAYLASFDAEAGTSFSRKLVAIGKEISAIASAQSGVPGQGLTSSNTPQGAPSDAPAVVASAREVAGVLMGAISQALGVVRVVQNSAPTATQTLMLSSSSLEVGSPIGAGEAAPSKSLFELPEGKADAVQKFLAQAAKGASDGKSILDQIASGQSGAGRAGDLGSATINGLPKIDFARLDMLGALHAAHSEPVDAPRFEALLSQASRAQGAEHVAQQAAPRFASLLMSQIKNATFVENRTRIELAPRGLGDIQISVETDPSGRVTAMVRAENPQVLELLRTDRAQLEAMLAEKGFDLAQGDLDFEGFSGHDEGAGDDDASGSGAAPGESDLVDAVPSAPGEILGADGHLNILA
jgi:flagellar hook-length control protein FliK